jgi:pimeloyl-ACP methyl ester carboxylesterase
MKRVIKWMLGIVLLMLLGGLAIGYTPDTDAAAMKAKYANSASRFITLSPGLNVHYRDEGKQGAPVLMLVHGSNASLHTWEPWVKALGTTHRIVTLDLPGHGLTGAHPGGVYDAKVFVSVVDALVAKLGINHFVIGGNSMGGGVSWNYALAHPKKLDGMLLVDASGAPESKPRDMPIGFRLARMPVIKHLTKIITPRALFEASIKKSMSVQTGINDALVDRYWELNRYPGNRAATAQRFGAMDKVVPATAQQLASIKVPVMIMWGAEDNLIPVAAAGWFAKAMPAATSVIYPGVGHIPMEEVAGRSAADVSAWLAKIPPRALVSQ